ncbi:PREDICTED: cation/H(+) antiporter 6B [Tarenaya hassleriana]|uniref:cation/H(+) antiporter 6B n=1 Tax=Tarenaya hassleriana TaxID=28532 RepID=UPI00053C8F2E|nr:PREDICTED: cation/H(+) antiporter 6B [Tarenaya hassleriana]
MENDYDQFRNQTWWKELFWYGHADSKDGKQYCEALSYRLSSYGVWERIHYKPVGMGVWEYPLPNLEIMIFSMFFLWRFFDMFFKKLHFPIPKFSSMMLAGMVLGIAARSNNNSMVHEIFFPDGYRAEDTARTIGAFGFVFFWFLRGVTMDVGMLKKTGPRAFVIGLSTLIVPMVSGIVFASLLYIYGTPTITESEYGIHAYMLSVTSFTGINTLLRDLKINHTEFGRIAQSSAMVTDFVWFLLSLLARLKISYVPYWKVLLVIMFFILLLYLLRQAMFEVIRRTPEGRPVQSVYIYMILLLSYISYFFWDYIMSFGPFGSFLLGLAIPDGPPLGSTMIQRFESLNDGIFLPLFGSIGMLQVDWTWLFLEFNNFKKLKGLAFEAVCLMLFLSIAKFAGSLLSALATKMPLRDSAILAIVLGNKSCFEMAYLLYTFEDGIIRREVFSVTCVAILANSLLTPMAIHLLHDRSKRFICYRKRNLLNLKPNSELRILVSISKPDNIASMMNFLKASYPSEGHPMSCYILSLVELVGQATPTFISHQLQKPKPGSRSFSDNVISSFQSFQKTFSDLISVQIFTSVSAAKDMHEDICWLSLDRSVNLILLSFHRTWAVTGTSIVSEDDNMRNLNRNILKRAPCSVGILVYRKPIWQNKVESLSQICLIFVGGRDDREALAFANRIRRNKRVSLTLMRFIPETGAGQGDEWAQMLDKVNLKEFMRNVGGEEEGDNSIVCVDKTVSDGTQTSSILQAVAFDYDLFIVGRSSGMGTAVTSGLSEWLEFDELGLIGDFLASEYYPSRASVLVLQQQECAM